MTAVLYDDVATNPPATRAAIKPAPKRRPKSPIGAGGDPLADAAAHLLSIPLRQLYAVLWRVGVIEVIA